MLARLREGDILTHCFRPYTNALVDENDATLPTYLEARARGVAFRDPWRASAPLADAPAAPARRILPWRREMTITCVIYP